MTDPRNPFRFGEVVRGGDFIGRKTETGDLGKALSSGSRVFLLSPRRYGKTSLIVNTLEKLRGQGLHTAYVDLYRATSYEEFLAEYAVIVAAAGESTIEKALRLAKELLPQLRPTL